MSGFRVFVSNIPWTAGHAELRSYFKEFGNVVRAAVVFDKSTGISRGYGFVTFSDTKAWERLSNQQRHEIDGWKIGVQKSTNTGPQRNN